MITSTTSDYNESEASKIGFDDNSNKQETGIKNIDLPNLNIIL